MFLIRDVVSGDPTLSTTLGGGGSSDPLHPGVHPTQAVVEPESSPGQLVEEALRILLTRLTGDITFKNKRIGGS